MRWNVMGTESSILIEGVVYCGLSFDDVGLFACCPNQD